MKRFPAYILMCICIGAGSISCSQRRETVPFADIPFAEGDVVFRKGIGAKTHAVLHADSSGIYSHTGIVVKDGSAFKIIHITPGEREKGETTDKIKMETAEVFWANDRAEHGAVYRLTDTFFCAGAARQAKRLLQKGMQFDHDYELSDTTQLYCTELVWYVYRLAGTDITNGKRSELNAPMYAGTYIFPSDIYTSKVFHLIYKF
ncbi:MAG: hypothetical protein LBR26_03905 [Prevotella sp.]|nr:hypothetical protein [Prevotella sp.]